MDQIEQDKKLIRDLGGPTALAQRLNYSKREGGVQRVSNWLRRGIPAHVKVQHPEIFLTALVREGSGANGGQEAKVE